MSIKNIFIVLIFLGVVGLALAGMFRTAAPGATPPEEVRATDNVEDLSGEDNTLRTNLGEPETVMEEPEMSMDEDASLNMETSSKEEFVYPTLSDGQGAVMVEVTPLNLENASETLDFKIALNTHSVDLSMNLAVLATLTTDSGKVIQAISWDAPLGGHHVSGTLSFPASVDGVSVLEGASKITLSLVNVDAPERVFTWER